MKDSIESTNTVASNLALHYEDLRLSFTSLNRGQGLALFLSQGMAAWIDAWFKVTSCTVQLSHSQAPSTPPLGSDEVRDELANLLATMAIHVRQGNSNAK
jgi:hypothetical protein